MLRRSERLRDMREREKQRCDEELPEQKYVHGIVSVYKLNRCIVVVVCRASTFLYGRKLFQNPMYGCTYCLVHHQTNSQKLDTLRL